MYPTLCFQDVSSPSPAPESPETLEALLSPSSEAVLICPENTEDFSAHLFRETGEVPIIRFRRLRFLNGLFD